MRAQAYLADWTVCIAQVDQQVVALEIKMHNILAMKVLHSKSRIHSNQDALSAVNRAVLPLQHLLQAAVDHVLCNGGKTAAWTVSYNTVKRDHIWVVKPAQCTCLPPKVRNLQHTPMQILPKQLLGIQLLGIGHILQKLVHVP